MVDGGQRIRIYQVREPKKRHLADIWSVAVLPPTQRVNDVLVVSPPELIANKVMAIARRNNDALAGTDWRDVAVLLLRFPYLKATTGAVRTRLEAVNADDQAISRWEEIVRTDIRVDQVDDGY